MTDLLQERAGRQVQPKGVAKQVIQTWSVMGEAFDLESRYKVIDYLGAGAYGVVCAAQDSTENNVVAIKKCKKIFQSRTLAKRTLRELRLLRLFDHDNVVKIKSVLKPLDAESFSEIYVVFEIMETDLAQIIRSPQTLKDQHVQYFTYQLLLALKYLHAANIVHRDLKPRNLLVNGDCCLKVADFGLARVYNDSNDSKILAMTEYVTTRWYRAPEVLVGWHRYTSAVDMWAVGCIVAELIGRMPLFPGADSMKQLDLLCRFSGKPSEEFIRQSRKASCRQYLNELPSHIKATDVRNLYPGANPQALDLVKRLLDFNPVTRITAEEALQHPYIQPMLLRNPTTRTEPVLSFSDSEFLFEAQKASVEDLRMELLREVNSYLPKPAQIPKAKGSFIVIDSESKDLGPTATLTAAALLLVQEKEKTTAADVEVTGSAYLITKDKQASSQSQLLGHASTEASISRVGSASTVNNSATAIHTASTAMLLAGPSETHLTKVSSGKLDEQIRGNKRGRLDTPATTAPAPALKDKNIAASSSSSALAEDVSVVSEKMKALSTAANAVAPDRTNALASTVTPSHTESYPGDTIPLYVRRGAKRTSLASERPASMAAASDSVTAISGLDDVPDEDCNDEGEWGPDTKRNASLLAMSETAAERVTTCAKAGSVAKITGNGKPKGESTASKGSKSLSSCLGRENDSDNADEGDAALDDRDDADAGICNFTKSGYRNSRRCRATKRALLSTSITTQKSEPCLIL